MAERKKDVVKMTVLIPRDLYEELRKKSDELGEKISVVVREAIRRFLRRNN